MRKSNARPADAPIPPPQEDWVTQREMAKMLGVSDRTASLWAAAGRLRRFEHGFPECGRKKYSRALVEAELQQCWDRAVHRHDELAQSEDGDL
jgi:hypothetical protein